MKKKNYMILKNIQEYDLYTPCVQFFILNNAYSKYPLEMDFFMKNGKKVFFIYQRHGGPTIDFGSPIFAEIENNRIGQGSLSIYPFYYNTKEKNTDTYELNLYYQDSVKFIKKMCTRIKIQGKMYWVGNNTIELIRNNKLDLVNY